MSGSGRGACRAHFFGVQAQDFKKVLINILARGMKKERDFP
jgi:hypothetical protein